MTEYSCGSGPPCADTSTCCWSNGVDPVSCVTTPHGYSRNANGTCTKDLLAFPTAYLGFACAFQKDQCHYGAPFNTERRFISLDGTKETCFEFCAGGDAVVPFAGSIAAKQDPSDGAPVFLWPRALGPPDPQLDYFKKFQQQHLGESVCASSESPTYVSTAYDYTRDPAFSRPSTANDNCASAIIPKTVP